MRRDTRHDTGRPTGQPILRLPTWQAALRECAILGFGLFLYLAVRVLTEGGRVEAMMNAFALRQMEIDLGIAWEASLQTLVAASDALRAYATYVYIYGYWPVLGVSLAALFVANRPQYYRLRNALILSGLVGLVLFAVYPVAPPRLSDPAIIDTVAVVGGGTQLARPASLVNEFAAMPSFHVGWILMVAVALAGAWRGRAMRVACILMPVQMAIVVIATGNHFVVDVVVGCAIAILALAVSARLGGVAAEGRAKVPPQPAT